MQKRSKFVRKYKHALIGGGLVLLVVLGIYIYYVYETLYPSTENAYVNANLINVSPKVGGYIEKIYVKNNQKVKKGDLLIAINPIDYDLQLQQAKQLLLSAQQEALTAKQQITNVIASKARALSNYQFAQQMAVRYTNLYKSKAGSLQNMQKYVNQANQAKQALEQATTSLQQATMQYHIAKTKIESAQIGVHNGEINQGYTRLYAPVDGYVSNLNLKAGQLVTPAQKLFGLIDDKNWWIDANMKETQLNRIKKGQNASIKLDMYNHHYKGKVQSISYASGSTFSLIPPENATGNWVKVIQYFTVRVHLKNDPNYPLRVGASATVSIDTVKKTQRS